MSVSSGTWQFFCQVSQLPAEVTFTVLTETKYKIWATQRVKAVPNLVKMLKTMLLSLYWPLKMQMVLPHGSTNTTSDLTDFLSSK